MKMPQLHDLKTTLATMKTAKEKGVNMCVWDRDIKAIEEVIAFLDALNTLSHTNGVQGND
jgi:hypothetical protein